MGRVNIYGALAAFFMRYAAIIREIDSKYYYLCVLGNITVPPKNYPREKIPLAKNRDCFAVFLGDMRFGLPFGVSFFRGHVEGGGDGRRRPLYKDVLKKRSTHLTIFSNYIKIRNVA